MGNQYPKIDIRCESDLHKQLLKLIFDKYIKVEKDQPPREKVFRIIAIDGVNGSGKTSIARYLAWRLGIRAILTDDFLLENPNPDFVYRDNDIKNILQTQTKLKRIIIVEGVMVLQLLKRLGYEHNYSIKMDAKHRNDSASFSPHIVSYEKQWKDGEHIPDYVFRWDRDHYGNYDI